MSVEKPKVVFDCMIFLQTVVRETSNAAACFRLAENRRIQLFISRAILAEVIHVLSRDHIRQRFETLTDDSLAKFIDRVRKAAIYLRTVPRHFDYQERDVKDEPYINLAIEVGANNLVSRDTDLLDLMNWNREAGREFQKRFRLLRIQTPETFLAEMDKYPINPPNTGGV